MTTKTASVPCSTGRFAGAKAAAHAMAASASETDREQIDAEKARILNIARRRDGMHWKELETGVAKIMQDYCGDARNETLLQLGLQWLRELREGEALSLAARNPHELTRALEVQNIITVGEMIIHACLARKASSVWLGHQRLDYPEPDPPEWRKFVTLQLHENRVDTGELPMDYWGPLKENYEAHRENP